LACRSLSNIRRAGGPGGGGPVAPVVAGRWPRWWRAGGPGGGGPVAPVVAGRWPVCLKRAAPPLHRPGAQPWRPPSAALLSSSAPSLTLHSALVPPILEATIEGEDLGALKTTYVLVDVDDTEIDVGKLAAFDKARRRALEDGKIETARGRA